MTAFLFAALGYAGLRIWHANRQIAKAMRENFVDYQG
jgi:hypothetical protein